MERIIKNATRIIAISENTQKDIMDYFDVNQNKIDVIYHGFNKSIGKNGINSFGKYLLFVGRRGGYKNFRIFARAASNLLLKETDLKLVCVGEPFNKDEVENLRSLHILEKTIAVSVDEKQLNNLFSNAVAFVYPSLYEGFGMPILEAFSNNCPVCLSHKSSLPEIAGDAAVYFDPNNEGSIEEAIKKIIYNTDFSQKLITKGVNRLKSFSWEKTVEQTIDSYKKAVSE